MLEGHEKRNVFDEAGNILKITTIDDLGVSEDVRDDAGWSSGERVNALNQMDSLTDSAENTTLFGFDVDGRLAEVNHPVEDLQTRYRYDLVGKLLESRVALDEEELWKLNYGYNLAGERLSQHSVWADGGNAFEYRLDASGRLIRESINRFVCDGVEDFAAGESEGTAFGLDGKLRLLAREDDFSATYLDLQRWEMAISERMATSVQMVQNDGLRWRTSVGDTLRGGRVLPAGTPIDFSNVASDYPHIANAQVADTVGWFEGRMLLRHRTPLTGAFDVQIALSNFNLYGASIGLGVTRDRFETADGASRFPTDPGGVVDANGCDIVIEKDGDYLARFNDEELTGVTVTRLRLKRFLDGLDWKLSAYYHDGEDWVTDVAWVGVVDDEELFPFLHLSGKVGYLRWSDFLDTVGDPYPTSGVYESRTYDAGRSVGWTRISWNEVCPAGTDVSFQVAVSEDAEGPWSYGSSLTTAAGTTITSTTGRYAKFKVLMTSDGSDTPVISDVQLSHDGASGSRVTRWTYDQAGNITEQARVTDTGTETDEREYNSLNQLTTSSGSWTYQYDLDGNLIGKNNGTAEYCEKWELSWDERGRLVQVKKGVYDATPVLVNEFTVDYQYDDMGRILRRDDGTDVTDYFYDGWDIWKEVTGESVTEYLVPGLGIRSFLRDGELYTLHADALGSARSVTDSEGAVKARLEPDAWGETLGGSVDLLPSISTLGFVGSFGVRRDSLTGLHWMRKRWYEPRSQRFVSRDPIGLKAGENLYTYCLSSPHLWSDPFGLDITMGDVLLGAAGAAVFAGAVYVTGGGAVMLLGEAAYSQGLRTAGAYTLRALGAIGTGYAGKQAYGICTGRDLFTGKTVPDWQRGQDLGAILFAIPTAGLSAVVRRKPAFVNIEDLHPDFRAKVEANFLPEDGQLNDIREGLKAYKFKEPFVLRLQKPCAAKNKWSQGSIRSSGGRQVLRDGDGRVIIGVDPKMVGKPVEASALMVAHELHGHVKGLRMLGVVAPEWMAELAEIQWSAWNNAKYYK